jgi:hypothetical protein
MIVCSNPLVFQITRRQYIKPTFETASSDTDENVMTNALQFISEDTVGNLTLDTLLGHSTVLLLSAVNSISIQNLNRGV